MPNLLRNALALVAGVAVGSAVNMGLILLGPLLIPPPPGADVATAAGLAAAMPLFEPRHFAMPFLAHALGTLAGALVAGLVAATHRAAMALAVGALFLAGGIAASLMIPAPAWFVVLDLVVAYAPMAWAGWLIADRLRPGTARAAP